MNEYGWLIIGTYIIVFLAGLIGGSVSMAIHATKLFKSHAERDIKELNRLLRMFQNNKVTKTEEGDEWKVRCVHGNSIMSDCVECDKANRGK